MVLPCTSRHPQGPSMNRFSCGNLWFKTCSHPTFLSLSKTCLFSRALANNQSDRSSWIWAAEIRHRIQEKKTCKSLFPFTPSSSAASTCKQVLALKLLHSFAFSKPLFPPPVLPFLPPLPPSGAPPTCHWRCRHDRGHGLLLWQLPSIFILPYRP